MLLSENLYLKVYRDLGIVSNPYATHDQAAEVVRQLGHMYNALGEVIKDFVNLLKPQYNIHEAGVQYEEQKKGDSSSEMDIELPIDFQVLSEKAGKLRE